MSAVHDADTMLGALDRLRGAGAEYSGFLSNHGPMAADAMIRLGGAGQVARWVESYAAMLEPVPTPFGLDLSGDGWRQHLGDPRSEGDWAAAFRETINEVGWRATLHQWWPRLLPGVAASASHGLIRTSHAVRNLAEGLDDEPLALDELAAGLSLWASRYQPLPGRPTLDGTQDLASALAGLPRLGRGVRSSGPGIAGRFAALSTLDGLPHALDAWGPAGNPTSAIDELIAAAAQIVLTRTDNPIASCHAVTAPAAVRMILADIPDELHRPTLAAAWQLVAALLAAFALTPETTSPPSDSATSCSPDPSDLARAAIDHGDEHVIKLTEASIRQHALTGDQTLLLAADAFRSRLPAVR